MKKVIPEDSILVPDQAKRVFRGQIFDVYQWPQTMFDGSEATFEMLKRPDTVVAICVIDDKIFVIDDEQPHTGVRQGFPGGRVDESDDSTKAAAKREVLEETGYSFENWRLIKVWQPHSKIEWFVHIFVASNVLDRQAPAVDAGEKITTRQVAFDELRSQAINKTSFHSDTSKILENAESLEQLLSLAEFKGQSVDR